ncbi:protein phosphatase Slingshot homolog 1-like isoform X2 [Conger conger]|uniref:protein phosphatase Slingshot homolog 1-like isoform X2 n=1 Tax=Conger conger TaxID=82655 RepID=UPI002A5ACD16|nr:protein phosphatase Slingshot homolog 1-like isoform X2 [Conger conger]
MALVTVQRSPTPSATSSPCVSEADSGEDDRRSQPRSINESFLTVKGAALFLPRGNGSSSSSSSVPLIPQRRSKHTGDLQQHLQTMFTVLRPEDTIRLAVRLESVHPQCTRYMVVVSTNGRQDTEESVVLGMDFSPADNSCSVGMVLPLWSDTLIHLDGDGGFSVSTVNRVHVFKPVSVQAMWSALQSLHKACEVARCHNYYPGSLFLTWVSYYQSRVASDQACINEWNAMQDVESHRADSPVLFTDVPTERERTERLIKTRLREIMMQKDLENVTSKEIRTELEMQMVCNLREFKEFIDNEMIVILGQMDSPTEIFEHVYLGSEWNASNLEELQTSGVRFILNVTREIDNFFPGLFEYHNIRVYDEEATDLLAYWNDTYKFISKAKKAGAKCLVHCKMGVSRSASTVIAYAMKEYGWDLGQAFDYVKERRGVTKPNPSFMRQLEEYQGILLASKQRHNKLWRSHSDSDLSERHEPFCKTAHSLGRSDPHNNNNNAPPSLQHFLQAQSGPPLAPNGLCGSSESLPSPTLPPLEDLRVPARPRPQAATEVPEESVDNALLTVAVTVPLGSPHPPPSLTILPPSSPPPPPRSPPSASDELKLESPELPPPSEDPSGRSVAVPEEKSEGPQTSPPSLSPMTSTEASSLVTGPQELPTPMPDSKEADGNNSDTLEPQETPMPVIPQDPSGPLEPGPEAKDDNNNPSSAEPLDVPAPVPAPLLSTDRIDFVTAREKFLGLSLEGPAHAHSEQAPLQPPHPRGPGQELQPLEDPSTVAMAEEGQCQDQDPAPPTESGDRAGGPRAQQENGVSVRHMVTELESISHPGPASGQPQRRKEELGEVGGAEEGPPEASSPPSHPDSPSTPPCECPSGSVRRVTEQLEQRLKPAPSPAPAAEPRPPPRPRLHAAGSREPPKGDTPSPGPPGPQGEEEKEKDLGRGLMSDTVPGPFLPVSDEDGSEPHPAPLDPPLSLSVLQLEGVTEQETSTDVVLETQGTPEGSREDLMADFQSPVGRVEVLRGRDPGGASEVEARIRQAGLTLPSLMKRSASLAKLGCLELNPDDLSEWEPGSASPDPQEPRPQPAHAGPDDAHKKQRVLRSGSAPSSPSSPSSPPFPAFGARQNQPSSPPSPLPAPPGRGGLARDASDCPQPPSSPPLVSPSARQQHGRTHPLRRLKKMADRNQTYSFLYSTM